MYSCVAPVFGMTAAALGVPGVPSLPQGFAALEVALRLLARIDTEIDTRRSSPDVLDDLSVVVAPPRPSPDGPPPPPERDPGDAWTIVDRVKAGDADAFGELYDRYVDMVFRYIHFRIGSREQAEDLTSETFVRALRRIGSVTWQGRDFGAWLVTIARNLIADHYKSARYRLEIPTADMIDADRAQDGPENYILDAITSATLIDAVKRLTGEQQECIVLRFLQGFSVAETAQTMGKNEGAIKALQYRAVRALARLLPDGFQL